MKYFCINLYQQTLNKKLLLTIIFSIFTSFTLFSAPSVTITAPNLGTKFKGGQEITFKAYATDPIDGVLKKNKFSWQINYRHDDHWHDNWSSLQGDSVFLYQFPSTGDLSSNVYFKIRVTVTNSLSETQFTDFDIYPYTSVFTITSSPIGAKFQIGTGTVITTPSVLSSVENLNFSLSNYLQTQTINGISYKFRHWNFCSTANAVFFNVPQNDTLITLYFAESSSTTTGFIEGCGLIVSSPGNNTVISQNVDISMVNDIICYPNPASDIINLESESPISSINIKNSLGQIILILFDKNINKIDISNISKGLYFIEIHSNKNVSRIKFNKN